MPKEAEGRRGPKGDVQTPVCRADGGAVPRETWARGTMLHCTVDMLGSWHSQDRSPGGEGLA